MKEEIKKALIRFDIEIEELDDTDEIETIFQKLESDSVIDFGVYVRSTTSGDYWLQCEYYSKAIGKTIVWDYDFDSYFEDNNDLIDVCITTQEAIQKFESRLSLTSLIA